MSNSELEEGRTLELDFGKLSKVASCGESLVPAVVQHAETGDILIVGYANRLALDTALESGLVTFWSTSRNELWIKGKTSGDTLKIVDIRVNCEQNSILYRAIPENQGACHTKNPDGTSRSTCYYRKLEKDGSLSFV